MFKTLTLWRYAYRDWINKIERRFNDEFPYQDLRKVEIDLSGHKIHQSGEIHFEDPCWCKDQLQETTREEVQGVPNKTDLYAGVPWADPTKSVLRLSDKEVSKLTDNEVREAIRKMEESEKKNSDKELWFDREKQAFYYKAKAQKKKETKSKKSHQKT